jgi:cytochrome c oxidase subunit II
MNAPCAFAATPLSYLTGYGVKAYPVVHLTWALLILSITVVLIITGLVCTGIWRRRAPRGSLSVAAIPTERSGSGLNGLPSASAFPASFFSVP